MGGTKGIDKSSHFGWEACWKKAFINPSLSGKTARRLMVISGGNVPLFYIERSGDATPWGRQTRPFPHPIWSRKTGPPFYEA
jgi:hypothetical protein